jgi:hypothetical protein
MGIQALMASFFARLLCLTQPLHVFHITCLPHMTPLHCLYPLKNRAYLRDLKVEQRNQWIADARIFKETWADDAATWYYFNEATGKRAGWAMYENDR